MHVCVVIYMYVYIYNVRFNEIGVMLCLFIVRRCHPPAFNSISPSSPLYLSSTSLGNLVLISSQSALLTNVSDLVAVRSQEPTRTLQRGQLRLLCSKVPFKHRKQRLCVQGSVTGSINIPRHTGHIKSLKFTSAEDRNNEISNNFDVRFKYVAIFSCSCRGVKLGQESKFQLYHTKIIDGINVSTKYHLADKK